MNGAEKAVIWSAVIAGIVAILVALIADFNKSRDGIILATTMALDERQRAIDSQATTQIQNIQATISGRLHQREQ